MTEPSTFRHDMTCDEVAELAGLFVLDALEPDERDVIVAHLSTCAEAHQEIRDLGGVVPALATLAPPIDAPAALKADVMAAVAREAAAGREAEVLRQADDGVAPARLPGRYSTGGRVLPPQAVVPARGAWQLPAWASWGGAVAAVLIVAVVGVWALGVQSRANTAEQRAADLSKAIAAFSAPGSSVAVLRESGGGTGSGFAALSADGSAYVVMTGLPSAPAGQTYQAWYIVDSRPTSAGLLAVGPDGLAVLVDPQPMQGTQVVALTREPEGGSEQPTSAPFALGELHPA